MLFRSQNDLIVGCPAANRELEEVQDMIGLFVNTLVICTTLRKEKGFEALVKDVHASFQDALSTQAYPFEKVVDGLHIERNPSRTPLFDVFVALEDSSWSNYRQGLLKMQPMELPHNRSKFDLSFYFKETKDDGFAVHIEYCTALFKEETITLISERFKALLNTILQKKETPLSALEIMPESELARINAFNDTTEPFDRSEERRVGKEC